jgi:hypothetical protein
MILHHVDQCAHLLVERAASFNPDRFRRRDLHVVDILAVPQRLENAVAETEGEDVLHGLLAQVVVDAVDRRFRKDLV